MLRHTLNSLSCDDASAVIRQYAAISIAENSSAILGDINHHHHHGENTEHERKVVADWYSRTDFADQQTDQLSRRAEGTDRWFLTSPEYQHWNRHVNTTLLCPGIPGSGKSIMVATIVDDLRIHYTGDMNAAIIYFYCNYNRQSDQDLRHMLRALVRQLFQELEETPEAVRNLYDEHTNHGASPSIEQLRKLLRQLTDFYDRVFIVIDALDQCANIEQDRDQLLDELFALQKQRRENVNILITTRFIPDIIQRFQGYPQIEVRAHKEDIEVSLDIRMAELPRFVLRDVQVQKEIKRRIIDAAQGMFLLARLQFDSLRDKTNPRKMEEALKRFNKSSDALDSAYDDVMDHIDHQLNGWRVLARRVLLWITYARRELSIAELQEAVAIEPDMEDLDHEKDITEEDQLVSVCHGLVEVDRESRIIPLVHYTTKSYLEKTQGRWFPDSGTEIARSCFTYLNMKVFAHDQCKWRDGPSSDPNHLEPPNDIGVHWNLEGLIDVLPLRETSCSWRMSSTGI